MKTLLVVLLFTVFTTSICFAQIAGDSSTPASEVIGENDRISFMQHEQNSSAQEPGGGTLLYKTLGAMILIVGLIFGGAWGARKLGFGHRSDAASANLELSTISSLSLGNGRIISAVQFGSRVLLVGSTAQSFTLLAEESDNETANIPRSRSVAEMLAEESGSFGNEFAMAQQNLGRWENEKDSI
jgi:flagellar biogenesis protein FliO